MIKEVKNMNTDSRKVSIEVNEVEVKALSTLLKDAQVTVPLGYILGSFMAKIERAFIDKQESMLKNKYSADKKKPEKEVTE